MKIKRHTRTLTDIDVVNVTLISDRGKIIRFALNYCAEIDGRVYAVYRVDNHHGFLHEQQLWKTKRPIPIKDKEGMTIKNIIIEYVKKIENNYQRYRRYFEESLKCRY